MGRKSTQRVAVFIRALGAEPVQPNCDNYKAYLKALEQQAQEARIAGRVSDLFVCHESRTRAEEPRLSGGQAWRKP